MSSFGVSRIEGVDPFVAIKAPVKVATTANITLSGAQTIDGIAVAETTPKTRVLVRSQTNPVLNGIFDVYATEWQRSSDFNGSRDVVSSTLVRVEAGSTYQRKTFSVVANNPIAIGVSEITFEIADTLNVVGNVTTVATFAALAATPATVGQVVDTLGYSTAGIGSREYIAISQTHAATDNVTVINSATTGIRWRLKDLNNINVEDGGALGYPTDDTVAIQRVIDAFPLGKKIKMYGDKYKHTGTIYLRVQGIFLEGAGLFATDLVYVNAAGGTGIKANSGTTIINGAGISGMSFSVESPATAPDITIDMSGFSYCEFRGFEINATRPNAAAMKFYSDLGTAPYFNVIDSFSIIGGADKTQKALHFTGGAWAGGSRGGNANMISNLKRAASLSRVIDLKEGQGNSFVNIGGESIVDDFIALNDIASYEQTGTITSATAITVTVASAPFPLTPITLFQEYTGYSFLVTGGTGAGQCRQISTHTTSVLTLNMPFGVKLDGTSTYAIARLGAEGNMFTNIRQEGQSGNFIKCLPGGINNKLKNASVSGVTNTLVDLSGDPSNHLSNGDLVLLKEIQLNPGVSANIDIWPRSSALGGIAAGRNFNVEWIYVKCPGIVTGVATITLDVGGATVGGGTPTLKVIMDSVLVNDGFTASTNKNPVSSLNNGLFLNLTTDGSMNVTTDFEITVAIRIH